MVGPARYAASSAPRAVNVDSVPGVSRSGPSGLDPAAAGDIAVAMSKIRSDDYRVKPGHRVRLTDWPTQVKPLSASKEKYLERLNEHTELLSDLQGKLWAEDRRALLLIFQAMDAAGKDSAIKHVMSGINPQGCQVHSFKHPGPLEMDHDFLWRAMVRLPERGRIGIFNRSYYEDVLVVKVHPEFLAAQALPPALLEDKHIWKGRYRSINDFEAHLHRNGTTIVKFYLHLSKGEQRRRFLARIDDPEKNWKFSQNDLKERALWKHYMSAFEDCMSATSSKVAPWYIVPADHKKDTRLIVSQIVLDTLRGFDLAYPTSTPARRRELLGIRKQLAR
jgi:PPK2 family polyphosphate:nucleotide phosphotransferase